MIFHGITGRYERRGIFNLEEILPRIGWPHGSIEVPGTGRVTLRAQRYLLMKQSADLACVSCGIQGLYFALERCIHRIAHQAKGVKGGYTFTFKTMTNAEWHFNLYAMREDGTEILMTKDHIVPKSKGGRNEMWNYQLMCQKCNSRKGNVILLPASSLEAVLTRAAAVGI